MTFDEINKEIKHINKISYDPELAHGEEDELYYRFIQYISKGNFGEISKKAKQVLKTKKNDFPRWYA